MPSDDSNIGWTDATWNPVHGCSKVSAGCANCYAAAYSQRMGHTDKPWTTENAEANVRLQEHHLDYPSTLPEPSRIFVNSMSDLFHDQVPLEYVDRVMDVVRDHPQHAFIALTKHGVENGQLWRWNKTRGDWPENLWMGVSVESKEYAYRIDDLRRTDAATKWVSFEPLIDAVGTPDLRGIDWVVVGGESGANHRPMNHKWVWPIRDAALEDDVAFFFKQSSHRYPERGTALEGRDGTAVEYREFPRFPDALREARPDLAQQEVAIQ